MAINQLISAGGRGQPSPVERFLDTKAKMEASRYNQQTMQMNQEKMGMLQQQEQRKQQQYKQKQDIEYMGAIEPLMRDLENQADAPISQYYTDVTYPALQKIAETYGRKEPVSDKYDRSKHQQLMATYESPQWKQIGGGMQQNIKTNETKSTGGFAPTKPVQAYGPNKATAADPNRWGQSPINAQGQEIPGKWVNQYSVVNKTEAGGPGAFTKGASTQLDKDLITQGQMRDSINILSKKYKDFKASGYNKNKLTSWASSIGNVAENIGITLPDNWSEANATYDDMMVASGRVMDAYRKKVTGAQASVQELDRFLLKRVPNEGDAETRFEAKLQAVIEFDEIASIRLSKLKQSGWVYAGTIGVGDDQTALVRNGDRVVPVSQAMSLDMIPMFEDRRNEIMSEMAKGKQRADISPAERKKMAARTTQRLRQEGYNLDAR